MWSVPGLQTLAGFQSAHEPFAKAHIHGQWECTQGAGCGVGVCRSEEFGVLGFPWSSWQDLWARCPQRLVGRLLGGVCNMVSRICVPLMPSESPICCSLNLFPPPPQTQYSGWDRREMSLFGIIPTAGETGCSPTCCQPPSPQPPGKIMAGTVFLGIELCCLEGR